MLSHGQAILTQFISAPLEIIDGDRGKAYPKQTDFFEHEFCLFLNAGNVTQAGFNFENCAFITKEKDRELRKGKLQRGDIVLTTRGTVGNVAYFDNYVPFEHIRINSGMVIIRTKPKELDSKFLYSFLRSKDFENQVKGLTTGSAQPQLPIRDIQRISIPFFPLAKQKYIANVIGNIDRKIELNNQINENLESMAKAIFKEWFIDFGPVKAKAEGRKPFGMDDETAALFPDRFEESELGLIPKGWRVAPISTITDVNKNVLKKTDSLEVIDYVEISSVGNGVIISGEQYQRGTEPSRAKRKIAHGDTVLSTVRPERAAYFLAFEPSPNQIVSTGFAVFSAKHVENWAFLHSVLTRGEFFEELGRLADGGAYPAISPEVIASQKIVLPPNELIASFQKLTSSLYELKDRLSKENNSLAIARDLLLPKLISGELTIRETFS